MWQPEMPFDSMAMKQATLVLAHQRQFGFNSQVSWQQYATVAHDHHHEQGLDSYDIASIPNVVGGSLFKNQFFTMSNAVAGSTVGIYGGPRDHQNPKLTRMTIFYDRLVNVFYNLPVEKAQELMLLTSMTFIPSPPCVAYKLDSPTSTNAKITARQIVIQNPDTSVPRVSGVSTPVVVVSQAMTLPKSSSSSNSDSARPKSAGLPLVPPPLSQAPLSQPMSLATTNTTVITPRVLQPRAPYLAIRSTRLDGLVYDQQGMLNVELFLGIIAKNGNARSDATISYLELRISFHGMVIMILCADPFDVPRKGSLPLGYVARLSRIPLDGAGMTAMEIALTNGVMPFATAG
ncbi:hypothetical protein ABZP36_035976 [Zizania latifolia]